MGISVAQYDMLFLKPLDKELLKEVAENFNQVITVENGVISGGLGSAVIEYFSDNGYEDITVHRLGIPDEFITHGTVKELLEICKLDENSILEAIIQIHNNKKKKKEFKIPLFFSKIKSISK